MCLPVKPFKIEAEFEHAGLKCAVTQNREAGFRCGYVRVLPGHSAYGRNFEDVDVNVHGGLTFGEQEPCSHDDGTGWWFGFDCGHAFDASYDPGVRPEDCVTEEARVGIEIHRRFSPWTEEHYWTQEEVEGETRGLAEQFAALA